MAQTPPVLEHASPSLMATLPPRLTITPRGPFDVSLRLPGSKSLTHRALLLAALAEGESIVRHPLQAEDTSYTLGALRALGYDIRDEGGDALRIVGGGGAVPAADAELFFGNAGTAIRLMTGFVSLGGGAYTLGGVERMGQRPIGELVEPLRQLGAEIDYLGRDGCPPLRVRGGKLTGGDVTIGRTLSSQYISSLLMIGPCMSRGLTLHFDGPITSKPYVELTLGMMRRFGVEARVAADWSSVRVEPGTYRATDYTVEPDASSASYFLAAAAAVPGSRVTIEGLGRGSLQGDAAFADVLGQMGIEVTHAVDATTVRSQPGQRLRGIDVDLNGMPDAAMTPTALAILADSPTTIRNVGNWRVKESDRMAAMQDGLTRLGAHVLVEGDDITVTPPADGRVRPATIETYDDHRVAMSFAVVGLAQPGVTLDDPGCVGKSFPDFFEYLGRLRP